MPSGQIFFGSFENGGFYGPGGLGDLRGSLRGRGLGQDSCDPSVDPSCGGATYQCPNGAIVFTPSECPPSSSGGGPATGLGCDPTQAGCNFQCPNGVWTSDMSLCPTSGPATGLGCDPGQPGCDYECPNGVWTSDLSLCSSTGGAPGGGGGGGGGGVPVGQGTPSNPASASSQISNLGTFFGSFLKSLTGSGTAPAGYHYVGTTLVSNLTGLPYTGSLLGLSTTGSSSTLTLLLIVGAVVLFAKK
jgi:hypothetical protein